MIVAVFGVSAVGVTGVNLHVFAYVTDIGYSDLRAVGALSVIASTQLGSPLVWGLIADRVDVRWSTLAKFLIQAAGLDPGHHLQLPGSRLCRVLLLRGGARW